MPSSCGSCGCSTPVALQRAEVVGVAELRAQLLEDLPVALLRASPNASVRCRRRSAVDGVVVEQRVVDVEEVDAGGVRSLARSHARDYTDSEPSSRERVVCAGLEGLSVGRRALGPEREARAQAHEVWSLELLVRQAIRRPRLDRSHQTPRRHPACAIGAVTSGRCLSDAYGPLALHELDFPFVRIDRAGHAVAHNGCFAFRKRGGASGARTRRQNQLIA